MGALYRFDLQPLIEKYKLVNYVETGFGDLTSFNYAKKFPFKNFYGVDLDKDWYDRAVSLFQETVILENDYSTNALQKWIKHVSGNTCFYLDSHFIGSDYRGCPYDESIKTHKRHSLPLEDEINIICSNRNISQDVFVIDDFVLYEEFLPCEWGKSNTFKHRDLVRKLGINLDSKFLYEQFKDTHDIQIDLRDQGYFVAIPKL